MYYVARLPDGNYHTYCSERALGAMLLFATASPSYSMDVRHAEDLYRRYRGYHICGPVLPMRKIPYEVYRELRKVNTPLAQQAVLVSYGVPLEIQDA